MKTEKMKKNNKEDDKQTPSQAYRTCRNFLYHRVDMDATYYEKRFVEYRYLVTALIMSSFSLFELVPISK